MVDRVIKMLKEDPNLNIDQLDGYFTNEAADNMRERIRRRLEKEATTVICAIRSTVWRLPTS